MFYAWLGQATHIKLEWGIPPFMLAEVDAIQPHICNMEDRFKTQTQMPMTCYGGEHEPQAVPAYAVVVVII